MDFTLKTGSETDLRVADFIVAYNEFEKTQDPYEVEFSDFNVSEHNTKKKFSSRAEAKEELLAILRLRDVQSCQPTLEKMESLLALLEDTETGCTQPIPPYLHKAIGIELDFISDTERDDVRQTLQKLLDSLGVNFEAAEQGLADLTGNIAIEDAPTHIEKYLQQGQAQVEELTGIPFNFTVTTNIIESEERFRGEITGRGRNFKIVYNKTQLPTVSTPMLRLIGYHELAGHGGQYTYIVDQVKKGNWPIHSGITTMADSGVLQAEALAQVIPLWLDDGSDPTFTAALLLEYYDQLNSNNAMVLAHEYGPELGPKIARDYLHQNVPYKEESVIRTRVNAFTSEPLERTYMPVYPCSIRMMKAALDKLSPHNFQDVLRKLYLQRLNPNDLNALMRSKGLNESFLLNTSKSSFVQPSLEPQILAL